MLAIEADDDAGIGAMHASGHLARLLRSYDPADDKRRTPLMLAYWLNKPAAAKALVNAGSDYQQQDADGNNAAWYAQHLGVGERASQMDEAIEAGTRRLSMDRVIDQDKAQSADQAPDPPPAGGGRRSNI